jgi:hypothetical protein
MTILVRATWTLHKDVTEHVFKIIKEKKDEDRKAEKEIKAEIYKKMNNKMGSKYTK